MRFKLFVAEFWTASHVAAFGRWWAASAARRLGKLSGRN
jgi:hypothetical protein